MDDNKRLRRRLTHLPSFNGATAMMPWMTKYVKKTYAKLETLQWGHGDDAVDDLEYGKTAVVNGRASMGPRR